MSNAMVNWAWDTKYGDTERYRIIHDELAGLKSSVGCSVTYRINAYYLRIKNPKFKGKGIVIIDTPGFADVSLRDSNFQENMYAFLNKTNLRIKGVCFTVQANETRATAEFSYVIGMTLDFFGKDVLKNLHGMCTFASTKKPEAA